MQAAHRCNFPLVRRVALAVSALTLSIASGIGCYAPIKSYGIPACQLGDEYRTPRRTAGPPLNFSTLTVPQRGDYVLGPEDVLEVTIHGLYPGAETRPVRVRVMASGEIYLPMVGAVKIGGMNLLEANEAITKAYADGFIKDPRTNVTLAEKSMTNVVVLGEVRNPGVHRLPKYENDLAHALAAAGGLAEDAADEIEVHRRQTPREGICRVRLGFQAVPGRAGSPMRLVQHEEEIVLPAEGSAPVAVTTAAATAPAEPVETPVETAVSAAEPDASSAEPTAAPPAPMEPEPVSAETAPAELVIPSDPWGTPEPESVVQWMEPQQPEAGPAGRIVRIPLRGVPAEPLGPDDARLQEGDVVKVPSRKSEAFYVVGKLSPTNFVRFNIGARERDLGAGFLLPRDREVDVVTAVAMAGYIDPIDSPTTVTVHRKCPDGEPLLILVDLIRARYDRRENVLVEAGDIIYLNPDLPWYVRRTFDRVVDNVGLSFSYRLDKRGGK